MAERTLLAVVAHPGDESCHCGGVLARYAAAGARVVLVCATRGQAGAITDPALATPATLGEVRTAELEAAAATLGIAAIHWLDYQDGTLAEAVPFPEGVRRVAEILATERPATVVTFGPEGVYGHYDHVMVHRWAKQAFADAHAAGLLDGARLYYCAPPRGWYRAISARCRAHGLPDRYGPWLDWMGVPDVLAEIRLDVAAHAAARLQAIRAHRTQLPTTHPFLTLPERDVLELLDSEWYTRYWPPRSETEPPETTLLPGAD
ncbi:MAG: PIG-L family deacetylase [Chloroflexi bacterium]|nr:PIG-L family deacetylase [Chloroflexota bacterium]